MSASFVITKDSFLTKRLVIFPLIITWLFLSAVQTKYEIFSDKLLVWIILAIILAVFLASFLIKNYKVIGKFTITTIDLTIEINNNKSIIEIGKDKCEYIKFYYKAFKGDQPVTALVGWGTLYFYSGAGNTMEIFAKDQVYKFDIKIDSQRDYNILKEILAQIDKTGYNVIMARK
jgi:hypothetical protein